MKRSNSIRDEKLRNEFGDFQKTYVNRKASQTTMHLDIKMSG